ncbi:hypothetical protein KKE60_04425 [Patescibacteria group bacterium]|nr:hypothetical protein [Patescibacteria group bacterium]
MSNVNRDNIYSYLKSDFQTKLGYPFLGESGSEQLIKDACQNFHPEKLRAMWQYYIEDADEGRFGHSIKRFTEPRVLMKLAPRVHRSPSGYTGKVETAEHICEGWLCWPTTCTMQSRFGGWPAGTVPDVHPEPCYYCKGPMVRVGSARHGSKYQAGMEQYKVSPDYIQWPEIGKELKKIGGYHEGRKTLDAVGGQGVRGTDTAVARPATGLAGGTSEVEPCATGVDEGRPEADVGSDEDNGQDGLPALWRESAEGLSDAEEDFY